MSPAVIFRHPAAGSLAGQVEPVDPAGEVATVHDPREELSGILARIDQGFNTASTRLGDAVTRIDRIRSALAAVAGMFEGGLGAAAVDGLQGAATALLDTGADVAARQGEIAAMQAAARSLRANAEEAMRCLQVLDIYGMNVKITASGLPQFSEFADAMRLKLNAGDREVRGLDDMIAALERRLRQMEESDRRLDAECARVVPQVPDSLLRDAASLRAHQAGLARLAAAVATVAQATQAELFATIGTIQIGDRVRQRLEHVLAGLRRAAALEHEGGPAPAAGLAPFLVLLSAQLRAAAADYGREMAELVAAIHRLGHQGERLASLDASGHDAGDAGGVAAENDILGRIEASIAEAQSMLAQLERARTEGGATLDLILETVAHVTERAEAITELRIDVQHMAINIGLSCRTAAGVGRPVMVIANEIRTYSNRLDLIADKILSGHARLSEPFERLRHEGREEGEATGEVLARFIATIGECSGKSRTAMAEVEAETGAMRSALASAAAALDEAGEMAPLIATLAGQVWPATPPVAIDAGAAAWLQPLFDELARSYTMAEEREVHQTSLPPGIAAPQTHQPALQVAEPHEDEDDGLF
jgi:hypothetical protein